MADNIPKQRHGSRDPIQRAGWVTTWLVKDVSSGDDVEFEESLGQFQQISMTSE